MSDESSVAHPLRAVLERWGVGPGQPVWDAVAPAVERGTGAVLAVPPAPAWAAAGLVAALERALGPEAGLALILVPEAMLGAWAEVAGPLASAAGRSLVVAPTPGRAARLVRSPHLAGLVTTTSVAAELLARSALPADRVRALMIAWPELDPAEGLADLVQALPKEAVRIVVTADPAGQADLIERYAWRAPVAGPLGSPPVGAPAIRQLRVAEVPWSARLGALPTIVDLEDPDGLTIWTADTSHHQAIRDALAATGIVPRLATGGETPAGTVVAFDPPPPEMLASLDPDRTIVLMPPGADAYLRRWAGRLTPLALPGPADHARAAAARERRLIQERIDGTDLRTSLVALAPLFERFPAQSVAAALHGLWSDTAAAGPGGPQAAPLRRAPDEPAARVWVSAGKKDGVTIGAWLAFLVQDLGVPRASLGRLDLRETFTLIECSGLAEAEDLVRRLAGRTLKDRRLAARVDRGQPAPRSERRGPRRHAP